MGTQLDLLKLITGESDNELLSLYLSLAKDKILNYTNRRVFITAFEGAQLEIAQYLYEKRGLVAVSNQSEGGITSSFIEVNKLLEPLAKYRIARVGGKIHEKTQDETDPNL